jgi:hypothetical protein
MVLRGMKMSSFGSCAAMISTKNSPRPPGETPVVRITLRSIWAPPISEWKFLGVPRLTGAGKDDGKCNE